MAPIRLKFGSLYHFQKRPLLERSSRWQVNQYCHHQFHHRYSNQLQNYRQRTISTFHYGFLPSSRSALIPCCIALLRERPTNLYECVSRLQQHHRTLWISHREFPLACSHLYNRNYSQLQWSNLCKPQSLACTILLLEQFQ